MVSASRALCLLVLALALCQVVTARPQLMTGQGSSLAKQIVQTFKEFNTLSERLRSEADYITVYNAPYRGYKISQALSAITEKVDKAISLLDRVTSNGDSTLSDDDAKLVVAALTKFVEVHSGALDAVINKHGLVTLVPYVEGIRQALLNLEQNVNDFAYDLVDCIPTQARAANEQFGMLGVKLHEAIATYEEPMLNVAAATLFGNH